MHCARGLHIADAFSNNGLVDEDGIIAVIQIFMIPAE